MKIAIKSQSQFFDILGRLHLPLSYFVLVISMLLVGATFATIAVVQHFVFENIEEGLITTVNEAELITTLGVKVFDASNWILQTSMVNA